MFSKEEMLPEEERRQVEERLKVLDGNLSLPESLSPQVLHQKLSEQDLRSFREAGHPDFMYWRRYAGAVASFIVVLVGLVVFTSGDFNINGFLTPKSEVAVMDTDESYDEYAAAPQAAPEAAEEAAPAPAPEAFFPEPEEKEESRNRLYASSYSEISDAILQSAAGNATIALTDKPKTESDADTGGTAEEDTEPLFAPPGPDVSWQKDFTDLPGEMPDLLKSDGTYFYYYSAPSVRGKEGKVSIIEAETLKEVTSVPVGPCLGAELLIRDGRLIIISRGLEKGGEVLYDAGVMVTASGDSVPDELSAARGAHYGVTAVSVYDLSDLLNPTLTYSFMQDGNYRTGRLIGDRFCLITDKNVAAAGPDVPLCDLVPVVRDGNTEGARVLDASEVAMVPNSSSAGYTTVSLLDVSQGTALMTRGVLGARDCYYSDGSIYFSYQVEGQSVPTVGISRMSIGLQDLQLSGSVTLQGDLDHAFALNRYDDVLRVATVTRDSSSNLFRTKVYTLDDTFHIIGSVEGLGTGEAVTDLSFIKEMVYITSSRETRPVLALNMEDPADPIIYGQIELDGVPPIYRVIRDETMAGLVPTAEGGLELGLYSTSGSLLKQLYNSPIPGDIAVSSALEDYRAMLCSSDGLVGFPVICRQYTASGATRLTDWGFAVFSCSQQGVEQKGILTHADVLSESIAKQRRDISRARIIGGRLYTFSNGMVKAHDLATMEETAVLRIS